MSHATELEIKRAKEGIADLRNCIKELEDVRTELTLTFFTGTASRSFTRVAKEIIKTVHTQFDLNSAEGKHFVTAADFVKVPPETHKDDLKRVYESNIAIAKDVLEEAIRSLQGRIAKLSGEELKPAAKPVTPVGTRRPETPSDEKEPIIFLKPSFFGVGINLHELWRRIKNG